MASLQNELELSQRRDGGTTSSRAVVDDYGADGDDGPPIVLELRAQLDAASDSNQELQEIVRRLTNDRQDLQAEVTRLGERLRVGPASKYF
jgi:hypothetical protein